MAAISLSNPLSQNPLLSLLRNSKTASQILQIHAQLITNAFVSDPLFPIRLLFAVSQLPSDVSSTTAAYAELVFSKILQPNAFAWNTIIRINTRASNPHRALEFFIQMRRIGVPADNYTYPFTLKACSLLPGRNGGLELHGAVLKRGIDFDSFVVNGLIAFYCRRLEMGSARKVFNGFDWKDSVSWNSLITGYVNSGEIHDAQKLFDQMPDRDTFSWAILIDGHGKKIGDVGRARELFDEMPCRDIVCWNSMIDCYVSVGQLGPARELFERMRDRNAITWSIMIDGHANHGDPNEALCLFRRMLREGTKPDKVSAVGVVSACAQLGALDQGRWVHSYLKKNKVVFDVVIQTSLIDMYMKCGSLDLARRIFESMPEKTVVSWNVMIVGLGVNGCGSEAVELFDRMERERAPMDDLTFLGVLTACTHSGLVSEALEIFDRMGSHFGVKPKVEHYGCLVDLFGRTGRLHEAMHLIETMPMRPTCALLGSLLAACGTHRCVKLAELVVRKLVNLEADDCGVYVLMSNIYADAGMWGHVWRTRKVMREKGGRKEIGGSVVEVDGVVHEFVNGDCSHPLKEEMHVALWSLAHAVAASVE